MSNTYTKENPPIVERNGVKKALTLTEFGKKSDNKGVPFWTPVFQLGTLEEDLKWAGPEEVLNTLNREYRTIFGDILIDNTDETTGAVNMEALEADWADFTAGVAKLSDIEADIEAIQDKQSELVNSPSFQMTEEGQPVSAEAAAIVKEMTENTTKIKALRAQRDVISQKYAVRAQKRKETKEKKAAAALAAKNLTATTVAGAVAA